jgi:uncharacterized membrane protein
MPKRFVPVPLSNSFYGIGFEYENLFAERFDEIIQGLVAGGIMKYIVEKMTKSKWNMMDIHVKSEKIVLNMNHLGFGFQICFFTIFAALVVFILEFFVFCVINRSRVITSHENMKKSVRMALMKDDQDQGVGTEEECDINVIEELVFGEIVSVELRETETVSINSLEEVFGERIDHTPIDTKHCVALFVSDLIE